MMTPLFNGKDSTLIYGKEPSWSCNQCLSPLTLWVRIPLKARCTWYNIMWHSLSVTCCRSVVFSGYYGFLHQKTNHHDI